MDKVKIKDVCDILNGFAFKSDNYVDKGIRIIRIANVQKGYIEDSTPAFYPLNSTGLDKYMLDKGDLLISLTGNVGRVAILQEEMLPAALNQRVACLRIKSDKISKGYLFHILNSDFFERKCIQSAKGVAQKNMSTEWLKNYKIPLYSTEQQSEIVSVLDTLQSIICNRKYELQMLDNLIKARFVELFGDLRTNTKEWKIQAFSELTDLITDGEHATPRRTTNGIYLLSARNILNHAIQLDDVDYIDQEEYDRIAKRVVPQAGDVLISCSGTVGRCCTVPVGLKFQMVRSAALLRFKPEINPKFAEYMITSEYLQEQINRLKTASSQANLFQGKIAKLKGFAPPMELQQEFNAFVAVIDKSKLLSGSGYFILGHRKIEISRSMLACPDGEHRICGDVDANNDAGRPGKS